MYAEYINCTTLTPCDIAITCSDNCIVNCDSYDGCINLNNIICPVNKTCEIHCNGQSTCSNITIDAKQSSNLTIYGTGGSYVLHSSTVHCPTIPTTNINDPKICTIYVNGLNNNWLSMIGLMNIYAVNALYDVDIICNVYLEYVCYHTNEHPLIHCGSYYNSSCPVRLYDIGDIASPQGQKAWICEDGYTNKCWYNHYNITTFVPTRSNTFNCHIPGSCKYEEYFCNDNENCTIICENYLTCAWATFHCPNNNTGAYSCNITCRYGDYTCYNTTFDASGSLSEMTVLVNGGGHINIFDEAIVYCPDNSICNVDLIGFWDSSAEYVKFYCGMNGNCNIKCSGQHAMCDRAVIYLNIESTLDLYCGVENADGNWPYNCMYLLIDYTSNNVDHLGSINIVAEGDNALALSVIKCPNSSIAVPSKCSITVRGNYTRGIFYNAQIYSYNGFDSMVLTCDYGLTPNYNCPFYTAVAPYGGCSVCTAVFRPMIYCNYDNDWVTDEQCSAELYQGTQTWNCIQADRSSSCTKTYNNVSEIINVTVSDIFICDEPGQCSNQEYQCAVNQDCTVICSGEEACLGTKFVCPISPNICNISVLYTYAAYSQIDASQSDGGTLYVNIINDCSFKECPSYIMYGSNIICPPNGDCIINANGKDALKNAIIRTQPTSVLNIYATGLRTMYQATIYCPNNTIAGNANDCNINVSPDSTIYKIYDLTIYARETVDIYLSCNYVINATYNCFGTIPPIIYCGIGYENNCSMQLVDGTYDEWEIVNCSRDIGICKLNTSLPIISTTTSVATNALTSTKTASTAVIATTSSTSATATNENPTATALYAIQVAITLKVTWTNDTDDTGIISGLVVEEIIILIIDNVTGLHSDEIDTGVFPTDTEITITLEISIYNDLIADPIVIYLENDVFPQDLNDSINSNNRIPLLVQSIEVEIDTTEEEEEEPPDNNKDGDSGLVLIIGILIGAFCLGAILMSAICYWFMKRKLLKNTNKTLTGTHRLNSMSGANMVEMNQKNDDKIMKSSAPGNDHQLQQPGSSINLMDNDDDDNKTKSLSMDDIGQQKDDHIKDLEDMYDHDENDDNQKINDKSVAFKKHIKHDSEAMYKTLHVGVEQEGVKNTHTTTGVVQQTNDGMSSNTSIAQTDDGEC